MKYLIIDHNTHAFKDMYNLFSQRQDAIEMFEKLGGSDDWGMGFSKKIGIATQYKCGNINLTFLPIEEQ